MRKVSHQFRFRLLGLALVCAGYAALTACSSADDELSRFIEDTKKEPGGRVEPLPEVKPYETFVYAAAELRSPFLPSRPVCAPIPNARASSSSSFRSIR